MLNVNILKHPFLYFTILLLSILFLCNDFPNMVVLNNMTLSFWEKNELS